MWSTLYIGYKNSNSYPTVILPIGTQSWSADTINKPTLVKAKWLYKIDNIDLLLNRSTLLKVLKINLVSGPKVFVVCYSKLNVAGLK